MTVSECLEQVAEIKGVTAAAVVREDGGLVDGTTDGTVDLSTLGGLIGSTLGASRALGELLTAGSGAGAEGADAGGVQQATIEYRDGPVLVVPVGENAAGAAVVIVLDSIAPLGRVRFQLRRLLPEIGAAVAVGA